MRAMRKLQSQGVHHITLVGADRQTSIDFWEGVLGMPFVFDQPNLDRAEESWRAPYDGPRRSAVIPIWRRPWMVAGRDTFTGDVLARLGVDNLYAGHPDRYPKIPLPELVAARPDLVVLPDEPYAFTPADGPEAFHGVPARCVSGRHLTWYGPSLVEARAVLQAQLA